jgi:hypothetical protein
MTRLQVNSFRLITRAPSFMGTPTPETQLRVLLPGEQSR